MKRLHQRVPRGFALAMLVLLLGCWVAAGIRERSIEADAIRRRYEGLRTALAAGDTNAARAFFAEEYRGAAHRAMPLLAGFMPALTDRSRIRVSRDRASVCPESIRRFRVIPGGHHIDLVRRGGEWFFTGAISVD